MTRAKKSITALEAAQTLLQRRQVKSDLIEWARYVQPEDKQPARHHLYLLDYLSKISDGDIDRLMVSMPPGHAKSTYSSVLYVPWFIANHPNSTILCATNTDSLALSFSKACRALIEQHSAALGYTFVKGSDAANEWQTSNGCKYKVLGSGSATQGLRADLVIIDDPYGSRDDANSQKIRDSIYSWYQSDIYSRINPGCKIIVIGTRWHEDDLMGRLIDAESDPWEIINLPAICESEDDPLDRSIGDPLWPQYITLDFLERKRANAGPLDWNSMYQGRPAPLEGSLFKCEFLKCLDAIPSGAAQIVRAWDLAATKQVGRKDPDWTVGLKLASYPDGRLIVLDIVRLRGDPHEVEAAIVATASQDGPSVSISIPQDPGAAGKAQISYLTSKLLGYRVDTSPESGDKTTRAYAVASQIAVGNVSYIRAQWNQAFLTELATFPNGGHDDQVDALSRATSMVIQTKKPLRSYSISFGAR